MKRIKKFGVLQTAKVIAILYFIGSAIFFVPLSLVILVAKNSPVFSSALQRTIGSSSPVFVMLLPLLYGVFGFILASISCLIYNFIATKIGGIEVEFDQE
jgi:hypothetical protein